MSITATSLMLANALSNGTELTYSDGLFSWEAQTTFSVTEVLATVEQMRSLISTAVRYAHLESEEQGVRDWLNSLIEGEQGWHDLGKVIDRRDRWEHSAGLLGEVSVHIYEALVELEEDWTDATNWPATMYRAGEHVWVGCQQPMLERV